MTHVQVDNYFNFQNDVAVHLKINNFKLNTEPIIQKDFSNGSMMLKTK